MRVGNFTLLVESEAERNPKVVNVPGGEYAVKIVSHADCRCDVDLEVNGARVGRYRLGAREGYSLPAGGRKFRVPAGGGRIVARFCPEYNWRRPGVRVEVQSGGPQATDRDGYPVEPIDTDPRGETVIDLELTAEPEPEPGRAAV